MSMTEFKVIQAYLNHFGMGLFSSPADKYSQERQRVSDFDLKRIVSCVRIDTLSQNEESLVEQTLLTKKRKQNGEISLGDIYTVLHGLRMKNAISINDEKQLLKQFEKYFGKV